MEKTVLEIDIIGIDWFGHPEHLGTFTTTVPRNYFSEEGIPNVRCNYTGVGMPLWNGRIEFRAQTRPANKPVGDDA